MPTVVNIPRKLRTSGIGTLTISTDSGQHPAGAQDKHCRDVDRLRPGRTEPVPEYRASDGIPG